MSGLTVSAPGKLMIAGEYVVLQGAEAIVTAVSRRAYAALGEFAQASLPPECVAARAAAERLLGSVPLALSIDVSELQQAGRKLGLGSSAAAAAASAGAIFAAHGHDLDAQATREALLEVAMQGHRAIAPGGSGADVAAAVLGGFLRFRKLGEGVETHSVSWPAELTLVVVWTSQPVRTSDMLNRVQALATSDPTTYRRCMAELAGQSEQLVSALIAFDTPGLLDCFQGCGAAMGQLGKAANAPIIEDKCEQIQVLARLHGGAAKPSGAGGGDVVLGMFGGSEGAAGFRAGCNQAGFEVLSVLLGVPGAREERK